MVDTLFNALNQLNNLLWGYVGILFAAALCLLLSFKSKWLQIRSFPTIAKYFVQTVGSLNKPQAADDRGVSPTKAFFASIGGCIGIGNIATIAVAVQVGGPGALVWVWLIALLGMIAKYAEIFLGIKYRRRNAKNGYNGGPMYFLSKAFPKHKWIPPVMAILLCIYGVEIYMFRVIEESVVLNWSVPPTAVTLVLLILIILAVRGGVERVGHISSILIPIFVVIYLLMTLFVLFKNYAVIPSMFLTVIKSAFTGHAAVGGFAGSTFALTVAKGISSACYSGDIGIGYASMMHSEAKTDNPQRQASLCIFGIFLDTFVVCTCTILLILSTGVWQMNLDGSVIVQYALSKYFPYMQYFMPFFIFILGYTTIIAYMCAGVKCARFISYRHGEYLYYIYGILSFVAFSFFDSTYALIVMNISGGLLMILNLSGIFKLRHEIDFNIR